MRESGGDSCLQTQNSEKKKQINEKRKENINTQTQTKRNKYTLLYFTPDILTIPLSPSLSSSPFLFLALGYSLNHFLLHRTTLFRLSLFDSSPGTVIAFQTDLRTVRAILFENWLDF